ncbi:MAG: hypothetical protein ABSC02_15360 [Acidobacteriota bacterium]|jgi:hypothetical protein
MNRRKFVVTSTVAMLAITIAVVGLSFYSNFAARAFGQGLPAAVHYFPADSQAIFGINVQAFINSPVYAQIAQQHEQEIGKDLSDIVAKTGVDPRKDIDYVVGAGRQNQQKGAGVVIAVGRFVPATIISFINSSSQGNAIRVDYKGATVLMVPEANGSKLEKGVAFLSDAEIAVGDLDSLHAVIDVRAGAPGIDSNSALSALLAKLSPQEMFWFAGDPSSVISKVPATAPSIPAISSIQSIYGSLNVNAAVTGKVVVIAKDQTAAGQLADFVRGLIALGNLAGGQNQNLADLMKSLQVTQSANELDLSLTLPLDLIQKLQSPQGKIGMHVPLIKK